MACVTNLDKFPKMFCSSCGGECPSTANLCHQCGQQLNLSQVSNRAESSVDKEKLLKEYFHWRYPYAAIIGRFYTGGRIMRLDELGKTFVIRLVICL